ncbi:MAG TPA: class IV adenylate cyclase [Vicinamibacterales bacterium]|nr:class IV adenylate cyclase [Vicinamibacterales bacterium]
MPLEREIKLRFDSAEEARAKILALGAAPLLGRRLQEDCLFDTDDEKLRRQRSTLRVRSESGKSLLTYKGPALPSLIKIRDEYETVVADGAVLNKILEELGMHCWFRYEKYREEFSNDDVVIAIDETPVGVFVEIEGGEDTIHETARALGRTEADYITDSYRFLFLQHRDANGLAGPDMVFAGLPASAPAAKAGSPGE